MTTFVIADTHFSHKATLKPDHCARPFASVEEMNEAMVERWNAKVKPGDTVYHLGDVAMWKPKDVLIVKRLNGNKFLIPGNHDPYSACTYIECGFKDVIGMKEFGKDDKRAEIVCTHVPVHPSNLVGPSHFGWQVNVHGHIHGKRVMEPCVYTTGVGRDIEGVSPDPRYFCVSVEHINYTPISLEELRAAIQRQRHQGV